MRWTHTQICHLVIMRYSRASLASQRLQVQHNPNAELQLLNAIWLLACWSAVLPKLFSLKFYTFKCISALTDGLFHHRERQFVCVYSGCLIAQHQTQHDQLALHIAHTHTVRLHTIVFIFSKQCTEQCNVFIQQCFASPNDCFMLWRAKCPFLAWFLFQVTRQCGVLAECANELSFVLVVTQNFLPLPNALPS